MVSKGPTVTKTESRSFPADKERTIQQKDETANSRKKLSELNNLAASGQYD